MKVSKKLFVLPFLVFAMASCGKTPESDDKGKDKEKDKPVEKTQVVIPELFSGETGTTPLENFTYDGTEKHVHLEGVVSDKVEVKSNVNPNEVGEYEVTYFVKDSSGNELWWRIIRTNTTIEDGGIRLLYVGTDPTATTQYISNNI